MRRFHLIEIHDTPACPRWLRTYLTDYLADVEELGGVYDAVRDELAEAVRTSGAARVVDLCSGGRGPWFGWTKKFGAALNDTPILLTDLYPSAAMAGGESAGSGNGVAFYPESVNATNVPEDLDGFRTLFTSFHHFQPETAVAILHDAVLKRRGIGVFEGTERTVPGVLAMLLTPIFVWLLTPRIRPFRWGRLFWTYLVPVVPLVVMIDGIVSCLRTYSVKELEALAAEAGGEDYAWKAGKIPVPRSPYHLSYLIGIPKSAEKAQSEEYHHGDYVN